MSTLLYYLPNETRGIKLPRVRELGLGYAFDDRMTPSEVRHGPDDGVGVVLADPRHIDAAQIGYFPDRQQWRRIPGPAGAYVGLRTDARPTPEDLARTQQQPGHLVKLRDGQAWEIPVARALVEDGARCALPAGTSIDDEGNWIRGHLAAAEAALWDVACRFWDSSVAPWLEEATPGESQSDSHTFDFAGENDAALTALTYNYRVGKAEVALLDLFDDRAIGQVLQALVDWPTLLDILKKKVISAG